MDELNRESKEVTYTPYYAVALGYKEIRATNALKRRENTIQYIK